MLVTCNETTDKVNTQRKLTESKEQLEFAIEAAKLGTWDYDPSTNKENFSITELTRDIANSIQATTPVHQVILNQSHDTIVHADKDRISQVITNLLTNAIKYSPNAREVTVDIINGPKDVTVSMQDFGIGMAHKDHDKVFDRFYRVENPEGKIFPGFGIGLFIVKEIIANHKGKVWVKSEPTKGSTFYFSLPM